MNDDLIERVIEACAKVCDDLVAKDWYGNRGQYAANIRALDRTQFNAAGLQEFRTCGYCQTPMLCANVGTCRTPVAPNAAAPQSTKGHGWITGTADVDAMNAQAWRDDGQGAIADAAAPKGGKCCACGYEGEDETNCPAREDKLHCEHWYDGPEDAAAPSGMPEEPNCMTSHERVHVCENVRNYIDALRAYALSLEKERTR